MSCHKALIYSPPLFFHFKLFFSPAQMSQTPCNLLQLNTNKGQGVIKTTDFFATQNTIAGNNNIMKCSTMSW